MKPGDPCAATIAVRAARRRRPVERDAAGLRAGPAAALGRQPAVRAQDGQGLPGPATARLFDDTGSAFYRNAQEVYRISNQATQEQRQFALYWADDPGKTPTPAGHWAFIANDLLKQRKASLAEAAQTFALLNMAMSDAFVAGWATKYQLSVLRPVTYVQLVIDSNWVPTMMDTPPFPEYPSAHSVQSSAAAGVLEQVFGARPASPTTPTTTAAGDRAVSRTSSRPPTRLPAHGCTPASISVLASPAGRPRGAAWPGACWP